MKKRNLLTLLFALTLTGAVVTGCNKNDKTDDDSGNDTDIVLTSSSALNTTDYEYAMNITTDYNVVTSNVDN